MANQEATHIGTALVNLLQSIEDKHVTLINLMNDVVKTGDAQAQAGQGGHDAPGTGAAATTHTATQSQKIADLIAQIEAKYGVRWADLSDAAKMAIIKKISGDVESMGATGAGVAGDQRSVEKRITQQV